MNQLEYAPEADPAIGRACASFLAQVRGLASVDGVVVLLLDRDQATSRVVFFWEAPGNPDTPRESAGGAVLPPAEKSGPSTHITLKGTEGTLGAVLIRGRPAGGAGPVEPDLVRRPAEHLAALLENILLQQRLDRGAQESLAFEQVGELAGSNAPAESVYQRFADEIKNLVGYQRLTVFHADRGSGLLTCAYRTGTGVSPDRPDLTLALSGASCELVVSSGEGCVVDDLRQSNEPGWLELTGGAPMRSAVVVPVVHSGGVVGVVALENRLPKAYGPHDESLLQRAAALLGPAMGTSALYVELTERDEETAVANEITRILASSRRLDEVFEGFASAASELVEFDCVTLAWLDPNGCDILTLWAYPGSAASTGTPGDGFLAGIQSRLGFGQHGVGTLALWRKKDRAFTHRDMTALDRLGIQVTSAVQYDRLHRLARRQAYQLGQLHRAARPVDDVDSLQVVAPAMVDQAARTLGAAFVAMYLYRDGRIATVTGADGRGGQDGCPDLLSPGLVAMVESCYRTGRRQAVGKLFAESTPMAGEVTETSEPYGYLGLPLPSSTGAGTVGVLVLGRSGAPPWPPTEMDLMQAFAADLAELVSPSGTARDSRQSGTRQPPDSLRRDLLVDAAHALRTPLSSIKGYSSTLLQADVTWPAELHQEFLETIDREADQLTRAPNDLLLPVEPEGGPLQLGRSPATVQSLLVAAEAELAAGTGRYPVVFECEPELPPVLVDQTRMVQVIVYLTRCAGLVAAPDAVLRVHAAIKGDRTEIRFGAFPEETAEETAAWGVRPAAGTQATGGGAVPPGWVDADLMLSVCNTLLSAHGVDLRVGPPGADAKMFRFDLPPVPSPSNDTSAGP